MFTFRPLLGAQSESAASQSLLELDGGVKILIDVGWDETFDVEKLKMLEKQVPTLSIILLTHATISHLGAFAHCCKHFPLFSRIPIYATLPVIQLGRTLLQDLYASTPLAGTKIPASTLSEASYSYSQKTSAFLDSEILLPSPTPEEIQTYFGLIHPLKYSQPQQPIPSPLSPPLNGLTITAYNAGHTLGGTIWHIQHGLESIVYAVDWNQARENVLAGAAWLGGAGGGGGEVIEQLRKPTALICSSRGAERSALLGGKAKRDELLLEMIKSAARRGGIILIPSDSSARILELAYLLEHTWRTETKNDSSPLQASRLYVASRNIGATIRYTKSMLEWMDEGIIREFEANAGSNQKQGLSDSGHGTGPFDFKHLRLLERRAQIDRILGETDNLGRSISKVILASDKSLEWGFSREILRKISDDSKNLVIFTERVGRVENEESKPTLARTLWVWWEERKDGLISEGTKNGEILEQVGSGGQVVEFRDAKRIALEGNDLSIYQQWLANQRQLQTTQSEDVLSLETHDASSDSSDSDESETEQQGKALNISATMGQVNRKKIGLSDEDLGVNILLRKKGVHDYDVRGKKGREKMFPLAVRRKRIDDFGELIRAEDFLRAEERDEVTGQEIRSQAGKDDSKDTLGKKRRWDDVSNQRGQLKGNNKRQQNFRGQIGSVNSEELSYGPEDDTLDEEADEDILAPSRLEYLKESVSLQVRLAFVDFAGLHDKRSLQMLIPLIQPRKLILIGGIKEETLSLANDCRKLLAAHTGSSEESTIDVYTPEIGDVIDASVDTNAWAVKLTDSLLSGLKWQNIKGLSIATVTARINASPSEPIETKTEGNNKKPKLPIIENEEVKQGAVVTTSRPTELPILDVLPSNMVSAARSVAQPLQVGDLRLADLRKIMQTSGYKAEFRGEGMLLIDNSVIVRKIATGRIEIESTALSTEFTSTISTTLQQGATFFAVRDRIYQGLAVVK
ncbi:Cleavage factor two protein 2 [Erysiphe necator]|uniref:Cleavage and polyadenylation specificity factor subunit 2 n=1 Tax=Uncinula necator TaxID=52586 RepID=A0A0B1PBK0_UNCNE|nr:Cleavage factor two protein 2 [Erysiphe necator]KHJ34281.1 putative rna-metabolising metallo-beta-lactamase [Erysiphe necator]